MKKKHVLAVLVPIILVLMLCQGTTALFAHQLFKALGPPGFVRVHVYPGFVLITLVLIHFGLNLDWVAHTYFGKKGHATPKPAAAPTDISSTGAGTP
jgi:hypothetical protein